MSLDKFTQMYLDYVNNFITIDKFAEHYNISMYAARKIVQLGQDINHL